MRKLFLSLIFIIGIIGFISGCGGGGGDTNTSKNSEFPTGNEDFTIEDANAQDPLSDSRIQMGNNDLLASNIDYSAYIPDVKSQGNTGSCTAWATGYYYKTYMEVLEEGWDKNINTFSPMYLFSMQCKNSDNPHSFIESFNVLQQNGCAKYSTLPFEDLSASGNNEVSIYRNLNISSLIHEEAKNYKNGELTQLNGKQEIKMALSSGPVVFGINYYQYGEWNDIPETNYLHYDAQKDNEGHAILCVGYDDSKFGVGAFKFVNSWGSSWGENGYSWIKYSDTQNIIIGKFTLEDLQNPNTNDNVITRPDAPTNIIASENKGPFVDISWSKTNTAQYYRIYRRNIDNTDNYQLIGTSYNSYYRDYPKLGVNYYYAVVSVNDIGESKHNAGDTSSKGYVDLGIANGSALQIPVLIWTDNTIDSDYVYTNFNVSNIDATATELQVLISLTSEGPWNSLGWINTIDFYIKFEFDSKYIGKKPFVIIIASSPTGSSGTSESAQINETITGLSSIADVISLSTTVNSGSIYLQWDTSDANADSFDIWRYKASGDSGNDWIYLANTSNKYYTDSNALPGVSYYYGIRPIYQGVYGDDVITDDPVVMSTSLPNLNLYEVVYNYGNLSNPAKFQLNVWNTGNTSFNDYKFLIYVYDWDDESYYYPFAEMTASDFASPGQLPLDDSNYEHTLTLNLNIPDAYADGHSYSWIIALDYYDAIQEEYEDDNYIWTNEAWWSYSLNRKSNLFDGNEINSKRFNTNGINKVAGSRPFTNKKKSRRLLKSAGTEAYSGPIRFKKPSFCIDRSN